MSRDEAEKELAELEPIERQEWFAILARREIAEARQAAWMEQYERDSASWMPKFARVQKLKTFLEMI